MANRTTQISECLNKLYDLMPDAIISYEVSLTFLEVKHNNDDEFSFRRKLN